MGSINNHSSFARGLLKKDGKIKRGGGQQTKDAQGMSSVFFICPGSSKGRWYVDKIDCEIWYNVIRLNFKFMHTNLQKQEEIQSSAFMHILKAISFRGHRGYWPTVLLFWYFTLYIGLHLIDTEGYILASGWAIVDIFAPIPTLIFLGMIFFPFILEFGSAESGVGGISAISITFPSLTGAAIILGMILLATFMVNWAIIRMTMWFSSKKS